MKKDKNMTSEKKNYYLIMPWGDGSRDGYLLLTQEEANIIQKAMDFNNWVHLEDDDGPFGIKFDANSPMTETEMEADYANRYGWRDKIEEERVNAEIEINNYLLEHGFSKRGHSINPITYVIEIKSIEDDHLYCTELMKHKGYKEIDEELVIEEGEEDEEDDYYTSIHTYRKERKEDEE